MSRGEAGVLRLLHSSTVPVGSLMPVLERFMRACPGARIDLDRASSEDQVLEIANGNADIGIVRLPVLRRDPRVRFVGSRPNVCVRRCRPIIRWRAASAWRSRGCGTSRSYRPCIGSGAETARVVIDLCLKRGFVPATARIVSPKTSMLNLVAAGHGVAIVPERMASLGIDGVVFVPISDEDARSVCALVLPVAPTVLADAFVRVIGE